VPFGFVVLDPRMRNNTVVMDDTVNMHMKETNYTTGNAQHGGILSTGGINRSSGYIFVYQKTES
jgi:hypothetical protein